jgi:cytochrome c peroxidase
MRVSLRPVSSFLSSSTAGAALVGLALSGCKPPDPRLPAQLKPPTPASVLPVTVAPPLAVLPPAPATDAKKVALGSQLYFDTRLSGDGTISCASCHALDKGGTDAPLRTSVGIKGAVGPINAPTVFNSHLHLAQFWDGRAATLEEQAAGPVENPLEMGTTWPEAIERLKAVPYYVTAFQEAYGGEITKEHVTHAIAEYERTLVTPSRYDRFGAGDVAALTEEERAGLDLFTKIGCTSCHAGPLLGGQSFEKMGTVREYFARRGGDITEADLGRFNFTKREADKHKFKVPTLRNVELTPPYFHDGFAATLEDAVKLMAHHQLGRTLTKDETAKIVAFLKALNGEKLPAAPELKPPPVTAAAEVPAADPAADPAAEPAPAEPAAPPVEQP